MNCDAVTVLHNTMAGAVACERASLPVAEGISEGAGEAGRGEQSRQDARHDVDTERVPQHHAVQPLCHALRELKPSMDTKWKTYI